MRAPLLLLLLAVAACAVIDPYEPLTPAIVLETVIYRTAGVDGASGAATLPDGTVVITGSADGRIGAGDWTNAFPLVLRLSSDGAVIDTAVYRDVRFGGAVAAVPFDEGMAVLVEQTNYDVSGVEPPQLTLHRTRADGTREEALFELAGAFPTRWPLLRTTDGGFLLVVSRSHIDGYDLLKLDNSGGTAWTYRMPEVQDVRSVVESEDGDLFVLGVYSDSRRYALARLTPAGQETWRRTYGTETLRRSTAVATVGNGAAVVARLSEPGPGNESIIVTRFDGDGAIVWERDYAEGDVEASVVAGLPDGGLVLGYAEHYADALGRTRSFIVRLSPDGSEEWRLPFGPHVGTTYASAIVPLGGGRLIAVGSTGPELIDGYGGDDFDVLAVLYQE